jgi:outer membrane lipoprotein-sorting protein
MNMKILKYISCLVSFMVAGSVFTADDAFEKLKKEYGQAKLVEFDVDIIIVSEIFDDADTSVARIFIADDERYRADINDDIYMCDGDYFWEYSKENEQVTKKAFDKNSSQNALTFFKNPDKYYKTEILKHNKKYSIMKISDDDALPDSALIYIDNGELVSIEYYDINDDLNKISFKNIIVSDTIDEQIFRQNWPDSVEIITLP